MKMWLLVLGLVVAILLQLFFLQGWQSDLVLGNVLMSYLVVVSLYSTKEQMLWMALFAGLISDLYSSLDFGFYLGLYLLLAIVCKYLLKFGETEKSWWRPLVVIAIAALLQAVLVSLPLIALNLGWNMAQNIFYFVSFSVVSGGIWYLLLNITNDTNRNSAKLAR